VAQSPALAVDPSGVDHVAYTITNTAASPIFWNLRAATGAGASWSSTSIDGQPLQGSCLTTPTPAIAIDSGSNVHVLYDQCTDGHQHYAVLPSGQTTWQNTALALPWSSPSALAVDGAGGLYAFVGTKNPTVQILFGYRAPGLAWPSTFNAIDPAGVVTTGSQTSANVVALASAVDASGTVYVAYATSLSNSVDASHTTVTQTVRVGVLPSGGSWTFTTLSGPTGITNDAVPTWPVALALSSSGVPHVAYVDGTGKKLVHAFRTGTAWTSETVDTASSDALRNVSIAVDSAGGVEIAYLTTGQPSYAYRCP
jgi:hypothetical protein